MADQKEDAPIIIDPPNELEQAIGDGVNAVRRGYSKGKKKVKNALAPFREAAAKITAPLR